MKRPMKPRQVTKFIERVTNSVNQAVKESAQVYVEYYDDEYRVARTVEAQSIRMEQTEHGPLKIIISEQI